MAAKRKARTYVYRPKSNGDKGKYLDYVARSDLKYDAVGSEDRHNPSVAIVQVQSGGSRVPFDIYNPPNVIDIFDLNPDIKLPPVGKKYCSHCTEWVKFEGYSPNKGNRDGLQSWCKMCRAEHARYIYWQEKHTAAPARAA